MHFIHSFKERSFISLSILLLIAFQGCVNRIDSVSLNGYLHGNATSYVYVSKFEGDSLALIDSVKTSSKGYFRVKLKVENPYFVTIGLNRVESPIILLIQPGEEIMIQSASYDLKDYKVFGSNGSGLIRGLSLKMRETKQGIDSLKHVYNLNLESPRIDSIKHVLDSTYNNIISSCRNYSYNLIKDNTFSPVSILALFQCYDSLHPVFDFKSDRKLFRLIDSTLLSVYSSNSIVLSYHAKLQKLDSLNALSLKRNSMFKIGETLPNVNYPLISGENLFISSIWYKYILVDFQGQWCESCKMNNMQLREIYKEYAPKGLIVLQVALGINPDSLRTVVLRDSLMWYNACVPEMYNSKLLDTLRISSVPSSYIADRWGVIKATNLSGNQLRLKLSELFPSK